MHTELNSLMRLLNEPVGDYVGNTEVRRQKEVLLTRLLVQVLPALSILSERVGREAAGSLKVQNGGVRLNVCDNRAGEL